MAIKALSNIAYATKFILSSNPRYGSFFLTTRCNRRCDYCTVPEQGSRVELPLETWYKIINKAHNWGVRLGGFLGGEPTLREDLPQIINYASKKIAVNLTSNGDTFVGTEGHKRLEILASNGLSILILSLHELEDADRQIAILQHAKKIGLIPILSSVVTKSTIEKLPDVMEETNKRGILYRYALVQNIGGSFSPETDSLSPTPDQLSTFIAMVREQKQKKHLIQNTQKYIAGGARVYPKGWHCNIHKDYWINISNEGKLMACNEYPTSISVLAISSLNDPRWVKARTTKREACTGCSYQCFMDEENLSRIILIREIIGMEIGLLRSRKN